MPCLGTNELWDFFKPGELSPGCCVSGNPGCAPRAHGSSPRALQRAQHSRQVPAPFHMGSKKNTCLTVRLMHAGARFLLHVCISPLRRWGRSTSKNVTSRGHTFTSNSLYFDNAFQSPALFSFVSVVCLQHGLCREGLVLRTDTMPSTRRGGVEEKSTSQLGPLGNLVL